MVTVFIVGVLLFFAVLIGGLLAVIWRELRRQARWIEATRQILASGLGAGAQIRTVGPSKLGGSRVFSIGLEVRPDTGEAAFSATVDTLVPAHAAGAIAPGKQVRVRFTPQDRAVAIDFEAMGITVIS